MHLWIKLKVGMEDESYISSDSHFRSSVFIEYVALALFKGAEIEMGDATDNMLGYCAKPLRLAVGCN